MIPSLGFLDPASRLHQVVTEDLRRAEVQETAGASVSRLPDQPKVLAIGASVHLNPSSE